MVTVFLYKAIYDSWHAVVALERHVKKIDDSGLSEGWSRIKMASHKAAFVYLRDLGIEAEEASEVIYEYGL